LKPICCPLLRVLSMGRMFINLLQDWPPLVLHWAAGLLPYWWTWKAEEGGL
jgi:hypothetical protein